MKILRLFAFSALAVLAITSAAFADPPSRAVRLKYMAGQVSLQPGGVDDWVPGTINRPLTTADRVWTDKDARAELHLGTSAMRVDGETSLTLTNVSDDAVQVELDQGTLNLRIARLYDGEIYEVDTPNLAFTITKPGNYRFDVDSNADTTRVIVWKGEGEATGEGPGVRLRRAEQALFSGGKTLVNETQSAPGFDGFDDWCRVRDEREDHAESVRHVPPGVIGYEDLDGYGRWVTTPAYGAVWMPAGLAAGWAPYRYGHWIWVEPWGWTWVDDAPWGFAPFHYGRWVHYRGAWGWCPGPVVVRPYYAPALVAWVGGSNWGVGLSFGAGGGMAWFPLGYGEPYVPSYRVSRGYFESVNISNTRITNITVVTNNYYNNSRNVTRIKYVNERVAGAVTAVPRDTIVNSRPVYRDAILVKEKHLRGASVITEPEMRPSRRSVLGEHAGDRAPAPPQRVMERHAVSKMPPPRSPRVFSGERQALGRDEGRRDDERRAVPGAASHDNHSGPAARGEDLRQPNRDHADKDARRNVPASVPRPDGNEAEQRRDAGRPVPRPPARDAAMKEREDRDHAANPPANAAEPSRTPRDDNRSERNVPRPPEKDSRAAEVRNAPATPVNNSPATRDNSRPERNIPRPSADNGRAAEVRNVPATPVNNSPATRDNSRPERNIPRPSADNGRAAEVRNAPASPVNNSSATRNIGRPERMNTAPPQRQSADRPAAQASARPSTQATTPHEVRAAAPSRQESRPAQTVRSAPPASRQSAPKGQSAGVNSGKRPAPATEQHRGAPPESGKDDKHSSGKS